MLLFRFNCFQSHSLSHQKCLGSVAVDNDDNLSLTSGHLSDPDLDSFEVDQVWEPVPSRLSDLRSSIPLNDFTGWFTPEHINDTLQLSGL